MKKTLHIRAIVLLTAIMILPNFSFSQEVTEEWVERYNLVNNNNDAANAIAVDDNGYSYVTGESTSNNTNMDYYTIKYDPDGVAVANHRYDAGFNDLDVATDIAVDGSGNVYVTGNSVGSGTSWDFLTIKYDTDLNVLWTQRYDRGIANEERFPSLAIDVMGNVYVTGQSVGSGTSWDYATIKYDTDGNELWVSIYNSTINNVDVPSDIGVDSQGNVYVTGKSVLNGSDYLTVKYNSEGVYQWEQRYNHANGNDDATALVIDSSDNVIVTGISDGGATSWDYATIKYAPNGGTEWIRRYNGPPGNNQDQAFAIGVDGSDNVYVTGASVSNDTSWDYATVKYDPDGDQQWVSRYDAAFNEDWASALVVDVSGNIYVTGKSVGPGTSWDYATIKYEPVDGDELWVQRHTGPGADVDWANSIAVDASGSVYVTGQSVQFGWDYLTIKYSQPFFFDCPELDANIGDVCDDQDETTENDIVGEGCECAGTIVTSVETIDGAAFAIFPNPASQAVFLRLGEVPTGPINVRIVNMLGQTVRSFSTPTQSGQQIELNISDIPAGLYLTVISIDNMQGVKRLVIE